MRYVSPSHGRVRNSLIDTSNRYLTIIFQPREGDAELRYVHIASPYFVIRPTHRMTSRREELHILCGLRSEQSCSCSHFPLSCVDT
jgi:hypothetical protein